ncbi:MAG: FkbM family methyltransferase [Planctomycetia bacterium]|nr:FkbM family methyltransferase [Planctomycetia bacterium]
MFRRFIERVSRGRVLKRHLPGDMGGGPLYVSPDAALQFWKGSLEEAGRDLFDFATRHVKEGSVVWDVGANVGLFTFAAAHRAGAAGTIVAVEPDLFCAELLERSRAAQAPGGARVLIVPLAVGAAPAVADFHIAERGRSASHLADCPGSTQSGGVRSTVPVPVVTLDWLAGLAPPPGVLKIDVETAEAQVLRGARSVLSRHRPVILCEVARECSADVTSEFKAQGYRLYDWEKRDMKPVESAPWMTLAVPS